MTVPFEVGVCTRCGHAVHPPRILCPVCANGTWRGEPAPGAVAEEITERAGDARVRIAAVRTDRGPRAVARAEAGVESGARVVLSVDDGGALVASAAGSG